MRWMVYNIALFIMNEVNEFVTFVMFRDEDALHHKGVFTER